jgi:hypothetical protein
MSEIRHGQVLYCDSNIPSPNCAEVLLRRTIYGSSGVARTTELITLKYWWETLRTDVKEYIRSCEACAEGKGGLRQIAPLGE